MMHMATGRSGVEGGIGGKKVGEEKCTFTNRRAGSYKIERAIGSRTCHGRMRRDAKTSREGETQSGVLKEP